MRILIAHSRYATGPVSGENRVVDDEARLLSQAGHQVSLWQPEHDEVRESARDLARVGAGAVWSRSASRQIRSRIRSHHPDVVHLHNLYPMLSPSVIRAATDEGVPVVVTLHNYRFICLPAILLRDGERCELCLGHLPLPGVRYGCYRGSHGASAAIAGSLMLHRGLRTFSQVALYLAVSGFVKMKHVEAGFDAETIVVKPNFSWEQPRREGGGSYFLFLGRLAEEKGLGSLLDMWRPSLGELLVAGDGPLEGRLRAEAPEGVRFLGRVDPTEVARLLASARALVLPSLSFEGSPRTVVEAYAAGVPVLASRVGALPEVVEDDVSGFLVDDDWESALGRLSDDRVSQRLGSGAFELWGERFSPARALAGLEEAYARVASTSSE